MRRMRRLSEKRILRRVKRLFFGTGVAKLIKGLIYNPEKQTVEVDLTTLDAPYVVRVKDKTDAEMIETVVGAIAMLTYEYEPE